MAGTYAKTIARGHGQYQCFVSHAYTVTPSHIEYYAALIVQELL
jgi:hypothetical protein